MRRGITQLLLVSLAVIAGIVAPAAAQVTEVDSFDVAGYSHSPPDVVVGADGTNGGLWCWPVAKTSRPTSSAFLAMVTVFLIRSCSVTVRPVVGSVVTSPTVKMPYSMLCLPGRVS